MKIAIFTDSYPPRIDGIARVSHLERLELEKLGHDVRIICPNRPESPYKDDAGVIALPSVKSLFYEGLRLGRFTKKAKKQLEDWRPDIIRIHTQLSVGLAGLRYGRQHNVPVVNTCHADFDLAAEYPGFVLLATGMPLLLRAYTGYQTDLRELPHIFANRKLKRRQILTRWILSQFSNASTMTTIPSNKLTQQVKPYIRTPLHTVGFGAEKPQMNLVPVAASFRAAHGISPQAFVIASTTRLVREKRVAVLIEGFANAVYSHPELELAFAVIGEGPERKYLQKLAKKLGVADKVIFLGKVENRDLRGILLQCNAYANACLRENFPLSTCEAALGGLPLLMCDENLSEVFVHEVTGLIFDDSQSLGEAIIRLARNPHLCVTYGKAAQARAELYTPENAVRNILALATTSQNS